MDDDALERLEVRVNSKEGSIPTERRPLYADKNPVPHEWAARAARKKSWIPAAIKHMTPLEALFAASIVFFIGAGSIAGLLLFSGGNTVSTKNVSIAVSGPTSIRAGDEVTLQVIISNQNAVPMNLSDLLVEFPAGTRSPLDVSIEQPRIRDSLGTIAPGASVNRTIKAIMFGQAQVPLEVKVSVEYRVPSSNAVFHSDTTYHTTISQSPATITVDTLKEVVSGQPTDITVTVASNATENLTGMLLVANYPPGFKFISSTPSALSGTSVWDLGDIEPSGTRKVVLHGTFTGEDGDERVVHFTTGTKKKTDNASIAAPLAATDSTLTVAKPFVSVQLALNDSTAGTITAKRGVPVHVDVHWANNLPVRVQDVQIEIKLSGAILDRNSVKVGQGFYNSSNTSVLFTKADDSRFASVEPGDAQTSSFEFAALPVGKGTFQSPQITLSATVKANRSTEGGVTDSVTSSATANVQVQTDLALTGVIAKVSGALPPKVDKETVYMVTLSVNNSSNAIANTVVSAVLPSYVAWKGNNQSDTTYNETGRTVTWNIGDMNAGAARTTTFQVGLTPSIPQINNTPTVLSDVRISAFDRFVRSAIEFGIDPITTATGLSLQLGSVVP